MPRWIVQVPAVGGLGAYDIGPFLVPTQQDLEGLIQLRYVDEIGVRGGVRYEEVEEPLEDGDRLRVDGAPFARWVRNTAGYHWPDEDVEWHRLRDEDHPNPWVTLCRIAGIVTWEGIVAQRPPGRWCDKGRAKHEAQQSMAGAETR